jgi:hypothetical protein
MANRARPVRSRFERFARRYGVDLLAARLTIRPSSIYHWLRGSTSPHPSNAIMIQMIAKERRVRLSLDDIYSHFRESGKARYEASLLKPLPVNQARAAIEQARIADRRLSRQVVLHEKTPLDSVRLPT